MTNEAAERLLKRRLVVDIAVQKAIDSMSQHNPADLEAPAGLEAIERLRGWADHALDDDQVPLFLVDVDEALADERRATVKRIRAEMLANSYYDPATSDRMFIPQHKALAILDAEAERHE